MALPHQSIATINSPEFINLRQLDINPLMSSCEIKVLYIGENRNRSYISKQTAIEMAKTLRGAPIVGYYKEQNEDFADHGEQVIFDDEGIHFNCLTKPYGFVSPDAKVWFQKFEEQDQFNNPVIREYLMTTGFLWTGQYKQVQSVITEGKPQSMELDEETLQGHWATNNKNNLEFFIINDAIFTKLCILGDNTEPCFEGASVTKPIVSTNFSKSVDDNFKQTLFTMINELRDALQGGNVMAKEELNPVVEEEVQNTFAGEQQPSEPIENSTPETSNDDDLTIADSFEKKTTIKDDTIDNKKEPKAIHANQDDEDDKDKDDDNTDPDDSDDPDDKDKDKDDKYSLLEQQYQELSTQYEALKAEYDTLVEFKKQVDNEKKDALINEFFMLSEEDKKDIVSNKEKYSLDEIKAKLAVICYEKKVNFNSTNLKEIDNNQEKIDKQIITYSYNNDDSNLPDWVKAVKNNENNI